MESKWIYRYIRADMEEIDMGFYDTEDDAQKAAYDHAKVGATVSKPEEVPASYKLYKGNNMTNNDDDLLNKIDLTKVEGLESNPKKLGGQWCIKGTRFPIARIFAELSSEESTLDGLADEYGLDMELLNDIIRQIGELIHVAHLNGMYRCCDCFYKGMDSSFVTASPNRGDIACPSCGSINVTPAADYEYGIRGKEKIVVNDPKEKKTYLRIIDNNVIRYVEIDINENAPKPGDIIYHPNSDEIKLRIEDDTDLLQEEVYPMVQNFGCILLRRQAAIPEPFIHSKCQVLPHIKMDVHYGNIDPEPPKELVEILANIQCEIAHKAEEFKGELVTPILKSRLLTIIDDILEKYPERNEIEEHVGFDVFGDDKQNDKIWIAWHATDDFGRQLILKCSELLSEQSEE